MNGLAPYILGTRKSGMTLYARDTFTDTNGTAITAHTMDLGGFAWSEMAAGSVEIQNNALVQPDSYNGNQVSTPFFDNLETEYTWIVNTTLDANTNRGVYTCWRCLDLTLGSEDLYQVGIFSISGVHRMFVFYVEAGGGGGTTLVSNQSFGQLFLSGTEASIKIANTENDFSITATVGASVLTYSLSTTTYNTSTTKGFRFIQDVTLDSGVYTILDFDLYR